jgi:hypothetical protein
MTAINILNLVETLAKKPNASVKSIKGHFSTQSKPPYDPTTAVPTFPIASLVLEKNAWERVMDAGHQVILSGVNALFGLDGTSNPYASSQDVYMGLYQALQQLANNQNPAVNKFARTLLGNVKNPSSGNSNNDDVKAFLINVVTQVQTQLATFLPDDKKSQAAVKTYFSSIQKPIGSLFDTNGKPKAGIQMTDTDNTLNKAMDTLVTAVAIPEDSTLNLVAASPGKWGHYLEASVDYNGINQQTAQQYEPYGLTQGDLFNLRVIYTPPSGQPVMENYSALCIKDEIGKSPNRIDRVLEHKSMLVRVAAPPLPANIPPDGAYGTAEDGDDGASLDPETYMGDPDKKTGIYALKNVDLFNILCIPPDIRHGDTDPIVYTEAVTFCVARRAMLIVDPPTQWTDSFKMGEITSIQPTDPELGINGPDARNAAVYFPRVIKEDLEMHEQPDTFPACGIIAGVMAATDASRGVWKAPAGQDAAIMGIQQLEVKMTDEENGVLNPLGINCLRNFPIIGPVVWGARTLRGADQLEDDYKYVPVRRLTLYIEESLLRGTKWAVFEPNDETLWSALRLSVGAFLADLQRQGAFYNYKVVCDNTTTTQDDIDHGIVNILVLIAPVKPAEFVVIKIQQMAGQQSS